ncbi:hypothetical protein DQ04_13921000 [Trypanosoma grayi]|uniref:hypothetical protein n=1 Tax=Trypanosoma grayi TaxID=71804 RepID=UPI0004F49E3B|nr:hypothetical protein DQ04_13921000 [Trypanosoma grayi]KEG06440.1 hypothetical protein DQ04_13921000 [Trypanosoma grayi]
MTMRCVLLVCALCAWCACGCAAEGDDLVGGLPDGDLKESSAKSGSDNPQDPLKVCSPGAVDNSGAVCPVADQRENALVRDDCTNQPDTPKCKVAAVPSPCKEKNPPGCKNPESRDSVALCTETEGSCRDAADTGLERGIPDRQQIPASVECRETDVGAAATPTCVRAGKQEREERLEEEPGGEKDNDGEQGNTGLRHETQHNAAGEGDGQSNPQLGLQAKQKDDSEKQVKEKEDERDGRGVKKEKAEVPESKQKLLTPVKTGEHVDKTPASGRPEGSHRQGSQADTGDVDAMTSEASSPHRTAGKKDEKTKDDSKPTTIFNTVSGGEHTDNGFSAGDFKTATEANNNQQDVSTSTVVTEVTHSNTAATAPAVENVKDTKNVDSSVSPVWVHPPLLLVALFAVTAVS